MNRSSMSIRRCWGCGDVFQVGKFCSCRVASAVKASLSNELSSTPDSLSLNSVCAQSSAPPSVPAPRVQASGADVVAAAANDSFVSTPPPTSSTWRAEVAAAGLRSGFAGPAAATSQRDPRVPVESDPNVVVGAEEAREGSVRTGTLVLSSTQVFQVEMLANTGRLNLILSRQRYEIVDALTSILQLIWSSQGQNLNSVWDQVALEVHSCHNRIIELDRLASRFPWVCSNTSLNKTSNAVGQYQELVFWLGLFYFFFLRAGREVIAFFSWYQ